MCCFYYPIFQREKQYTGSIMLFVKCDKKHPAVLAESPKRLRCKFFGRNIEA